MEFYIKSKRSIYKILPPGPRESIEEAFLKHPKEHSQQFPIKAMFMGVVAPLNLEQGLNGSVMIKRISKMKK
jgi:hypothetical protein